MGLHARQQALNSRLRDFLRERGFVVGAQLPSERDLAQALEVGRTVLRPALLALECEGIIARRAGAGTFLAKMPLPRVEGAKITLIVPYDEIESALEGCLKGPHENAAWIHRVVSAIEKVISESGAHIQLRDQSPRAGNQCAVKEMALEAAQEKADAVIFLHPLGSRETIACALALLHDRGVHPLIVSARTYPGLASQIYFDSGWGSYRATRHLLELGHRRIGFAGASAGHEWVQERLQGYQQALAASDSPQDPNWIWMPQDGERSPVQNDGAEALDEWLTSPSDTRPTAIIAANDVVALGLLKQAKKRGIAIPRELSVVGFDNQPEALLQGLTTIERPTETLGEAVAMVTLERLRAAEADAEAVSVTHRLRPVLIERGTTAGPGT